MRRYTAKKFCVNGVCFTLRFVGPAYIHKLGSYTLVQDGVGFRCRGTKRFCMEWANKIGNQDAV